MRSPQALAASAIRKELKAAFPNTKFSVTSQGYSGGNSVRVDWEFGPSYDEVDELTRKYKYGRFDGMTDCYDFSNRRTDLPQTKFIILQRNK